MPSLKRIPELRRLSEDHHHGLVLARRARLAGDGEEGTSASGVWEEVRRRFRDELEPHFRIEEKYLAPPLAALGETELIERFDEEHRMLRESVRDPSAGSPQALKEFGEMLHRHIRFEERELFETAQRRLSPVDLEAVEEACLGSPGPSGGADRGPESPGSLR